MPLATVNVSAVQGSGWVVLAWLLATWSRPKAMQTKGFPLAALPLLALWLLLAWDSQEVRDPWSASWWVLAWASAALAAVNLWRHPETWPLTQRILAGTGVFWASLNVMAFVSTGTRSTVLFNNPNILAGWLLGTAWCSLSLPRPWQRGLAFAIQALGLACTGSRAALVSLLLTVALYVLVRGGKRLRLVAIGGALLLLLSPPVQSRMARLSDDPTSFGRPAWWGIALSLHREQPGGLGTRQFGWHAMKYRPAFDGAPVYRHLKGAPGESAHSEWIQLLVDHGWGGPLLLLLAMGLALRRNFHNAAAYGLLALACHGLLDGNLQSEAVRILFLLFFAALWLGRSQRVLPLPKGGDMAGMVLVSLVGLLVFQPSVASWVGRSGTTLFQEARALPPGRLQKQRLQMAQERFESAESIDPSRARYPARLAALFAWQYEQGQVAQARVLEAEERAMKKAENRPHRLRSLADLYRESGRSDEALSMRQRLIRLEPRQAMDRLALAEDHLSLDQRPQALQQMQVALRLEPRFRRAWLAYAAALEGESPGAGADARAQAVRLAKLFRSIYCDDSNRDCLEHSQKVMSRLERSMAGDFIAEEDMPESVLP